MIIKLIFCKYKPWSAVNVSFYSIETILPMALESSNSLIFS